MLGLEQKVHWKGQPLVPKIGIFLPLDGPNVKKLLKPRGKMIISTINRNFFSKLFAIFIAENILNWIPKKTHTYSKLIKPEELKPFLNKNKIKVTDVTGLIFNPLSGQWMLDKNNCLINYFCTAIKSN